MVKLTRPVDFEAAILEQQEYESGECGGVYPGIEKFDPYGPQCEECRYSGGQHSISCQKVSARKRARQGDLKT